jgi:hypothetical protein
MSLKRDFTISMLRELYMILLYRRYSIVPVNDFFNSKEGVSICGLRHDVDKNVSKALEISRLEKNMGLRSTFFFRYKRTFDKYVIKQIYRLGHEIGYHYEVLSKTNGDYNAAIMLFKTELKKFREIAPITSICAHGAPFSAWDNKLIWKYYNFRDFGITTEAYLSLDFTKIAYFTDTGRQWNSRIGNLRDKTDNGQFMYFKNTIQFIHAIKEGVIPRKIIVNVHPERWHDNFLQWLLELIGQNIKNIAKELILAKAHDLV